MAALISTPMMVVASATTFASTRCPAAGLPACLPPPARTPVLGGSVAAFRGQSWAATTPSTSRATRMNVLAAAEAEDDDDEEEDVVERTGDDEEEGQGERQYRAPRPVADNFEEQVVQVTRVTKVVKGGKQLSFRAVVVVGDKQGKVGVGCAAAKEVVQAVQKAAAKARQECVTVPITRGQSFPHRVEGRHGAAKVMMRPAAEGCGVIAGGATRVVMELAGIRNGFGKQIGTDNPLNNARAAVEGLSRLRTWKQVSDTRGIPVSVLMNIKAEKATA